MEVSQLLAEVQGCKQRCSGTEEMHTKSLMTVNEIWEVNCGTSQFKIWKSRAPQCHNSRSKIVECHKLRCRILEFHNFPSQIWEAKLLSATIFLLKLWHSTTSFLLFWKCHNFISKMVVLHISPICQLELWSVTISEVKLHCGVSQFQKWNSGVPQFEK